MEQSKRLCVYSWNNFLSSATFCGIYLPIECKISIEAFRSVPRRDCALWNSATAAAAIFPLPASAPLCWWFSGQVVHRVGTMSPSTGRAQYYAGKRIKDGHIFQFSNQCEGALNPFLLCKKHITCYSRGVSSINTLPMGSIFSFNSYWTQHGLYVLNDGTVQCNHLHKKLHHSGFTKRLCKSGSRM